MLFRNLSLAQIVWAQIIQQFRYYHWNSHTIPSIKPPQAVCTEDCNNHTTSALFVLWLWSAGNERGKKETTKCCKATPATLFPKCLFNARVKNPCRRNENQSIKCTDMKEGHQYDISPHHHCWRLGTLIIFKGVVKSIIHLRYVCHGISIVLLAGMMIPGFCFSHVRKMGHVAQENGETHSDAERERKVQQVAFTCSSPRL